MNTNGFTSKGDHLSQHFSLVETTLKEKVHVSEEQIFNMGGYP